MLWRLWLLVVPNRQTMSPIELFWTAKKKGVGLVWSISCAAIHDRFTKVVFVVIFPCRKRNCRWTYCAVVSVVNENCAHVFAAQEKELPHRKKNCRWTTAKVSLLGWIIFSMMDFSHLIIMVGWPEMIERQERDTSFPYQPQLSTASLSSLTGDIRYQWPELKLKMKLWM